MDWQLNCVKTCYGVDLSAGRVVVVKSTLQHRNLESTVEWDAAADENSADFKALTGRLQREMDEGQCLVAGVMPVHELFTRWLQTPLSSTDKARKVLPSLLDIQLPFPLENCAYFFPQFRRSGNMVDALAVAARREDVQRRISTYRQAGLDPALLDHEGLALWTQSLRELPLERDAFRVVAYLGTDRCSLALGRSHGEGEFLSAHSLRLGTRDFAMPDKAPASLPESDSVKHFALRIQHILRAQFIEGPPPSMQWIWTGPGSTQPELLAGLQQAIGETFNATFLVHKQPSGFLARALSARVLENNPLLCDFRSGPTAHPAMTRLQLRQNMRVALNFLIAGLVLVGLNIGWRFWLNHRKETITASIQTLARDLAQNPRIPKGQEVLIVQRALGQREEQIRPFVDAFEPAVSGWLTNFLGHAYQNKMMLDSLSIKRDSITSRGTAEDWNQCELLANLLRTAGWTADINREDAGADERVHFAIKASAPGGGKKP